MQVLHDQLTLISGQILRSQFLPIEPDLFSNVVYFPREVFFISNHCLYPKDSRKLSAALSI